MSFSRNVYKCEPLDVGEVPNPISSELVRKEFLNFVRGEFGTGSQRGPCPAEKSCTSAGSIPFGVLESLSAQYESPVYDGYLDNLLRKTSGSAGHKVFAILSDEKLGNPANRKNVDQAEFIKTFNTAIEADSRLRFVFLGFPFKDQNRFRTAVTPNIPDAAEVALLIRLHALTLAIFQVLPLGVDWVVLSDGIPYHDIFRIRLSDAVSYRQRLQDIRTRLNLTGSVHILDLQQLADAHVNRAGEVIVESYSREIEAVLRILDDEDVRRALHVLKRGMKWNMQLNDVFASVGWTSAWEILNNEDSKELTGADLDVWRHIDALASDAAFRYAAFNIAVRVSRLLTTMLPSHMRATVHPKRGQVAIPRIGDVFPWNGVAVMEGWTSGATLRSIEVMPLYEIFNRVQSPEYIVLDNEVDPFVYLR